MPSLDGGRKFHGGTCLNKLVWKSPVRYSEDLDFVQTSAEKIGPTTNHLRRSLSAIFEEEPEWETRRDGFRLYYSFVPEGNPRARQRIKVEINTWEHFSVDGYRRIKLVLTSQWRTGEADVTTFSADELFATKVRALYQRSKGRDLFDLWKSRELKPDYEKIAGIFTQYMRRNNRRVRRDLLIMNLEEKLKDRVFLDDVIPLLVVGTVYDPVEAAEFVHREIFAFVPESKSSRGL